MYLINFNSINDSYKRFHTNELFDDKSTDVAMWRHATVKSGRNGPPIVPLVVGRTTV